MARRSLRRGGQIDWSRAGWRLVGYLTAAVVLSVVAVIVGGVMGLRFSVPVLLLLAATVAVAMWIMAIMEEVAPTQQWQSLVTPITSLHVASDGRTRRLERMIAAADHRHQMGNRVLAQTLRKLAVERRVREGADPTEPFAGVTLSRGLADYFARADTDAPPISRASLHRYLKEIDQL